MPARGSGVEPVPGGVSSALLLQRDRVAMIRRISASDPRPRRPWPERRCCPARAPDGPVTTPHAAGVRRHLVEQLVLRAPPMNCSTSVRRPSSRRGRAGCAGTSAPGSPAAADHLAARLRHGCPPSRTSPDQGTMTGGPSAAGRQCSSTPTEGSSAAASASVWRIRGLPARSQDRGTPAPPRPEMFFPAGGYCRPTPPSFVKSSEAHWSLTTRRVRLRPQHDQCPDR